MVMGIKEQIQYWVECAERDLPVAEHLFQKGDYAWCLFIGHLVLEKLIKAFYVRDNHDIPPKTHNLVQLVEATSLDLSTEQKEFLFLANKFNLEARYPDQKFSFYKQCDKEYTRDKLRKIKEMYQWLISRIQLEKK